MPEQPRCPPSSTPTPVFDDLFMAEIQRCPKSPALEYCRCYDDAALRSVIREQENRVADVRTRQERLGQQIRNYPRQTEVQPPPLNVPSRADQKRNTFSKIFDPNKRQIIVLLIAATLLFVALVSYD